MTPQEEMYKRALLILNNSKDDIPRAVERMKIMLQEQAHHEWRERHEEAIKVADSWGQRFMLYSTTRGLGIHKALDHDKNWQIGIWYIQLAHNLEIRIIYKNQSMQYITLFSPQSGSLMSNNLKDKNPRHEIASLIDVLAKVFFIHGYQPALNEMTP